MKFATPDELEARANEENEGDVSVADPTEATVDLPESGTVTIAEALAKHDQEVTVAHGAAGEVGKLYEALEEQRDTILRQREQIEELREAVEFLAEESGRPVDWEVEEWE